MAQRQLLKLTLVRRLRVKRVRRGRTQVGTRRSKSAIDAAAEQDIIPVRVKKIKIMLYNAI